MTDPVSLSNGWGERTAADLSSLLVELSRAQKARAFYAEDHAASNDLLDVAFLAWQSDLERAGPLDLSIDASGFRAVGVEEAIARNHLEALAEALSRHDIDRLQFNRDLTRAAFRNLLQLLGEPASRSLTESPETPCAFARELYAREHHGITVNQRPGPSSSALGPDAARAIDSPESSASLGSALLRARPPTLCSEIEEAKPTIDENPLEAPAGNEAAGELIQKLRQLDCCSEDSSYQELAGQVVALANELANQGAVDEAYRAPLVLADHAVGEGGRSGYQARIAQSALVELASAGRLSEIIERSCSPSASESVRAAQVLLQLGDVATPRILERLEQESSRERTAQLASIMVALGDRVVPTLARQMAEGSEARVLLVVRLAGEIQSPALVAPLCDLLRDGAPRLAAQAAKALVHIGNSEAARALAEALSNPRIEVAKVAAMCLGALCDPRTLQPLLATLERAREKKQIELAREVIRALSQFKQGFEAALPVLTAILQRRTLPWRRAEWQLKLEAVRTLGPQPGPEVLCALRDAARSRNSHLRRRAQQMLAHRTRAGIDPAP